MLQRPHPHHRGPLELLLAQTINQRPFYCNYTQGGTALSCPHLAAHIPSLHSSPHYPARKSDTLFLFPQALLLTPLLPKFLFLAFECGPPIALCFELAVTSHHCCVPALHTVICKCTNMLQIIGKGERWTDGVRGGERDRSM